MIELDGAYGEGGGSLTRTALALSALTGKPFQITNIRAGRPQPGLKAQHLHAIKALQQICAAKTNDVEIGSQKLSFTPGNVKAGIYIIDIGTAGSITLLLQAVVTPCLFAPGKVTLKVTGGTCGKWQASVDYFQNVLLPYLQRFVEKIELKVLKRGYYPKGGGEIRLEITPRMSLPEVNTKAAPITLAMQGTLEQIRGIINLSKELQEKEVGERIRNAAEVQLKVYSVPVTIREEYSSSLSIGGEVLLWAIFGEKGVVNADNPVILGSDALVEKGKSSEQIGREAAELLRREIDSGTAVDPHLADQLIIFMGLLPGSEIYAEKITEHARTNMYVVEQFLPVRFEVKGKMIRVIGLQ